MMSKKKKAGFWGFGVWGFGVFLLIDLMTASFLWPAFNIF